MPRDANIRAGGCALFIDVLINPRCVFLTPPLRQKLAFVSLTSRHRVRVVNVTRGCLSCDLHHSARLSRSDNACVAR